jgi:hypothetical protein
MQRPQDQAQSQAETTSDPQYHATNIQRMLRDAQTHARADTQLVSDPKARALFETTAEVLGGLIKAYDDYKQRAPAWQ